MKCFKTTYLDIWNSYVFLDALGDTISFDFEHKVNHKIIFTFLRHRCNRINLTCLHYIKCLINCIHLVLLMSFARFLIEYSGRNINKVERPCTIAFKWITRGQEKVSVKGRYIIRRIKVSSMNIILASNIWMLHIYELSGFEFPCYWYILLVAQ